MSETHSVTKLLQLISENKDEVAAMELWTRYRNAIVSRIWKRLSSSTKRINDVEDIEQVIATGFIIGAREGLIGLVLKAKNGKLPQIRNRQDLWLCLLRATGRICEASVRLENQQHNEKELYRLEQLQAQTQALEAPDEFGDSVELFEMAKAMPQALATMLELLPADLQKTAIEILSGKTLEEVAEALGLSNVETVERRIKAIIRIWQKQ